MGKVPDTLSQYDYLLKRNLKPLSLISTLKALQILTF